MKIATKKDLNNKIKLKEDELNWKEIESLPLLITEHYFSLLTDDENDPLRKQVIPSVYENIDEKETDDPQNERNYSVKPRLVHRYKNRVALLVTDICSTYCRHCFRRRFTGKLKGSISEKELEDVLDYLKNHQEVKEILLTGGDCLTLDDKSFINLVSKIREVNSSIIIRICTRMICMDPSRISEKFLTSLDKIKGPKPFFLTQFNHPRELNEKSLDCIKRIRDHKYLIFNQTVLLKDVNDEVNTLALLMNTLLINQVYPYYLFQADLVKGTSHFRVPLKKAMQIYKELRVELSGLSLPTFSVDLPFGGGKIPVDSIYYKGEIRESVHLFVNLEGKEYEYKDAIL